jgi:hypothetical protein
VARFNTLLESRCVTSNGRLIGEYCVGEYCEGINHGLTCDWIPVLS